MVTLGVGGAFAFQLPKLLIGSYDILVSHFVKFAGSQGVPTVICGSCPAESGSCFSSSDSLRYLLLGGITSNPVGSEFSLRRG